MRIANTVSDSIVDGPGLRFTVFTQGCPHRCPGCHNPDTHDPAGGREAAVEELAEKLLSNPLTDGLTLSGGEPFCQAAECARLAAIAREKGLNVWVYTGYTYERLVAGEVPGAMELLAQTKQTAEFSANLFEAFTLATLIYFTLNMSLMLIMRLVERKVAVPGLISVGGK